MQFSGSVLGVTHEETDTLTFIRAHMQGIQHDWHTLSLGRDCPTIFTVQLMYIKKKEPHALFQRMRLTIRI